MAKAVIEFDLDNPGDLELYNRYNRSNNMSLFINDVLDVCRRVVKHDEPIVCTDGIESFIDIIYNLKSECELNVDDL